MATMSEDDVTTGLRTVQQGLEALREEHSTISNTLETSIKGVKDDEAPLPKQKLTQINDNLEKLMCGVNETSLMLMVFQLTQGVDAQNQKYQAQKRRLYQENAWLRDELSLTQANLQKSERMVAQLEEEIKHLTYMASIKKFDDGNQSDTKTTTDLGTQSVTSETLQDLGFGPEEEEDLNSCQYVQPTPLVSVATSQNESGDIIRIRNLQKLAQQHSSNGQNDIAAGLCKTILKDLVTCKIDSHQDRSTTLNLLANAYRDQHKYEEAAQVLNEALSIREKHLGEDHPEVAATLNNLAVLCGKRGKYEDGEILCKRALEIREKVLGDDHPDVAKQLNNLALFCHNQSKYGEAENYYKRSLKIYESKLGPDDPNVAKTKHHLSSTYMKQGKCKDAEELYKQILTRAHEKEFGQNSGENKPIWQIAEEREENKHKGENSSGNEQADCRNVPKVDSPTIIATIKKLEEIHRQQGKYQAAETLADVVLRAKKQHEPLRGRVLGNVDEMTQSMVGSTIGGSKLSSKHRLDSRTNR
ncbi:hypothetical protein CAEBREN_06300 [Caenorhabditis brenneri]|uniref:Kinesin light chain n=1 Tax=Caenorhabditis brenneri TaxID=135651 RepID=G0MXF2_CAEBE|nr:hypothetical protein CAEBREN_06300 [Caenorhabditis brenneri]